MSKDLLFNRKHSNLREPRAVIYARENLTPAVEVMAHAVFSGISILTSAENEGKSAKSLFSLLTTWK